jgi:hypothetical protein
VRSRCRLAEPPTFKHAGGGEVAFTLGVQDPQDQGPYYSRTHPWSNRRYRNAPAIKGTTATLAAGIEGASLTKITPGQTLSIKASVTGISAASEAEFPIRQDVDLCLEQVIGVRAMNSKKSAAEQESRLRFVR